ncbi:MAG: class I SAM-dependent methyltransferase [Spirochaetes bacterium]|nr:class I SAM-dependent methyltransferase [Spirochaetota bacterium]
MIHINDTRAYHKEHITTLGWELTVCNMLYPENSPCRQIVKKNASYGTLLFEFLSQYIDMKKIGTIMEVGGGYGYLMKDFLTCLKESKVIMVDISPAMLDEQKKNVKGNATFILSDFLDIDAQILSKADLIICNEIFGDFITVCNLTREVLETSESWEIKQCKRFIDEYNLEIYSIPCNINLGALLAVEKMCKAQTRYIYVSEHSCESESQGDFKECITVSPTFNPYEIRLFGHSEFTIQFSHLEKVARRWGYTVHRGVYNDIFGCCMTPKLQFILNSTVNVKDEYEILRQFVGDMFTYEYLLCTR